MLLPNVFTDRLSTTASDRSGKYYEATAPTPPFLYGSEASELLTTASPPSGPHYRYGSHGGMRGDFNFNLPAAGGREFSSLSSDGLMSTTLTTEQPLHIKLRERLRQLRQINPASDEDFFTDVIAEVEAIVDGRLRRQSMMTACYTV